MVCFVRFDFNVCFPPQPYAFFQHVNCSEPKPYLLRATTACNFWFIIRPDGSAPAALASLLFDPPEPQNIGKTQWFATFLPFDALYSSFFWLILFSDLLSSPFLFSDSSHLCCFICPHMTSKLPLVTSYIHAGSWWHMSGSKPATSISHGGWLRTVFPVRGWLVTPINIG